jgi:hypothetical protein
METFGQLLWLMRTPARTKGVRVFTNNSNKDYSEFEIAQVGMGSTQSNFS